MVGEIEPFLVMNLSISFSVSFLIINYFIGNIPFYDVGSIILIIIFFLLGIYLSSIALSVKSSKQDNYVALFKSDNLTVINTKILFIISFSLGLFFSSILLLKGESLDDRLLFAKLFRPFNIIQNGASTILLYYLLSMFLLVKRKLFAVLLVLFSLVSFFSGSKGFLIGIIILYFAIDALLYGKQSWFKLFKRSYLILFGVASFIIVVFYWIRKDAGPEVAIYYFISRLFAAGDVYYYSFIRGDYTDLFGKFNFFSYIFHPFTAMVGIRGYDYPIGSYLFSFQTGELSVYGPNPSLPILLLVLLKGNVILCIITSFIFGNLVSLFRYISYRILNRVTLPPFWRLGIFAVMFNSCTIYSDIGLFEQNMIGVFIVIIMISYFHECLGLLYSKGRNIV
jgi:hypothetical protein